MRLGSTFKALPPVTKNLLIINIIIWGAINLLFRSTENKLLDFCALHYFTAETFNPAQLITYMFIHVDFVHLFFNMFALFMFGMVIERTMGSKRFLFYYITCGIGAALIQEGVFALMISNYAAHMPDGAVALISQNNIEALNMLIQQHPESWIYQGEFQNALNHIFSLINTPVVGASGAIFGVLLAFGFLFPRQPLYMMFIPVPIQARWFVIGYGALELLQGVSNNPGDQVAHFAHLGGMLIGLLLLIYWKKKGVFNNGRWF